jgi:hypothetical protein
MQQSEAFQLFLQELRSQAQQKGIVLQVDAVNFVSDVFRRTVRSNGVPNAATIKAVAKQWIEQLQNTAI